MDKLKGLRKMKFIKHTITLDKDLNSSTKLTIDNYEHRLSTSGRIIQEDWDQFEMFDIVDEQRYKVYVERFYALDDDDNIIASSVAPVKYNEDRKLVIDNDVPRFEVTNEDVKIVDKYQPATEDFDVLDWRNNREGLKVSYELVEELIADDDSLDADDIADDIVDYIIDDYDFEYDLTSDELYAIKEHLYFKVTDILSTLEN